MKIVIDVTSEVALYQQLFDRVVEGIASGELVAGDQLPSTRQLAADFGINFHTVRKAYDLLRQQGLIRLTRITRRPVSGSPSPPRGAGLPAPSPTPPRSLPPRFPRRTRKPSAT